MLGVLGLLNAQWLSAQIHYRLYRLNTAVTSPVPSPQPPLSAAEIIIPKIEVQAPFVTSETSYDQVKVQLALRKGVVHYGNSALPGQKGNVVVVGHSSGQLWAPGSYKFVFTLLNKLQPGDVVYLNIQGVRFVYKVTDTLVVSPTDLSVLEQTDKSQLTLITCTPVGTSQNRLIVHAKQTYPDPTANRPKLDNPSPKVIKKLGSD